jgi:hypothetical protein
MQRRLHKLADCPDMIADAKLHRWRDAQSFLLNSLVRWVKLLSNTSRQFFRAVRRFYFVERWISF